MERKSAVWLIKEFYNIMPTIRCSVICVTKQLHSLLQLCCHPAHHNCESIVMSFPSLSLMKLRLVSVVFFFKLELVMKIIGAQDVLLWCSTVTFSASFLQILSTPSWAKSNCCLPNQPFSRNQPGGPGSFFTLCCP